MKKNDEIDTESAIDLALKLMQQMKENKIEGNIAQAAFGCAWIWSCKFLGCTAEQFSQMITELSAYYKASCEHSQKESPKDG